MRLIAMAAILTQTCDLGLGPTHITNMMPIHTLCSSASVYALRGKKLRAAPGLMMGLRNKHVCDMINCLCLYEQIYSSTGVCPRYLSKTRKIPERPASLSKASLEISLFVSK